MYIEWEKGLGQQLEGVIPELYRAKLHLGYICSAYYKATLITRGLILYIKRCITRKRDEHGKFPSDYIDADPYILAFGKSKVLDFSGCCGYTKINGVYKYTEKKTRFVIRDLEVEDHCRNISPVNILHDYAKHPEKKNQRIITFLNDFCCNDESILEYVTRTLGYCITGVTSKKLMFFFYGRGNNAKSAINTIMKHVLGKYSTTLSKDALINTGAKVAAGAPSPHLSMLEGVRYAGVSEPKDDGNGSAMLNDDLIKTLAGGSDDITVRKLRENMMTISLMCKVLMWANSLPNVAVDEAIKTRLRVLNLRAEWRTQEEIIRHKGDKKNLHLLVDDFEKKIISDEEAMSTMLWILAEGAERALINEGWKCPNAVIEDTENFFNSADPFASYFKKYVVSTEDEKDYIISEELRMDFNKYSGMGMNSTVWGSKITKVLGEKNKCRKDNKAAYKRCKKINEEN